MIKYFNKHIEHPNLKSAIKEAIELSKNNPELYYTIDLVPFGGYYVSSNKRLNVFAPSDAPKDAKFYFKNGIQKAFTKSQIGNDWANTPTMR